MSYQLSRLDLVVNNAITQITVNTNPSTQNYINGDITPHDNIIDIASMNNRFTNPDDNPAATITSISKANNLTNLTATELGILNVPISASVAGNGLSNNLSINYDGGPYTQLLTAVGADDTSTTIEDLSDSNYVIVNNNVTVSNTRPFISGTAYDYNSLVFNGTSSYLSISDCTPTIFSKDDFTIEFFMLTSTTQTSSLIDSFFSNEGQWKVIRNITTNTISFTYRNSGNTDTTITSTGSITLNSWAHIALVKRDTNLTNNFTIYIDGIASGSADITDSIGVASGTGITIGKTLASAQYYNGTLSNIRIVNKAVYSGNFTVPSSNLSKIQQSASSTIEAIPYGSKINTKTVNTNKIPLYIPQTLTIYNNLNYTTPVNQVEVYDNNLTINSYNAVTSNINVISSSNTMNIADRPDFYITGSDAPNILSSDTKSSYNSLGGNFNGTSSYLSLNAINNSPLDLSTTPYWTIECWFNLTNTTSNHVIFGKGGTTGSNNPSYVFTVLTGGTGQWVVGDGFGGGQQISLTGTFATSTWYHLAMVRNGTTVTTYVNGTSQTPADVSFFTMGNTSNNLLYIGASADGNFLPFAGYISNFRIVKGVSVYTGNFIVPTGPLTSTQSTDTNIAAISGTQTSLLTLQNLTLIDNSTFANIITPVGVSTILPYSTSIPSYIIANTGPYYISTPLNPAYIRNKTKYNDPTQVSGYFNSFIPEHTGEEDRVQAWV